MPDFVKLAEAYGGIGLRASTPDELDGVIEQMLETDKVTIVDVQVCQSGELFSNDPIRQST